MSTCAWVGGALDGGGGATPTDVLHLHIQPSTTHACRRRGALITLQGLVCGFCSLYIVNVSLSKMLEQLDPLAVVRLLLSDHLRI